MTAGSYIVAVCALGGLIACAGFWWATRTGQFTDADEARWLVFDDEDWGTGALGHRGTDVPQSVPPCPGAPVPPP